LVIWGERDPYLGLPLLEGLREWVPDLRIERLPEASHWIQVDAPEKVNRWMIEFLRGT
jgi:pimeloyl-ACP methyl ester carboxylesterase